MSYQKGINWFVGRCKNGILLFLLGSIASVINAQENSYPRENPYEVGHVYCGLYFQKEGLLYEDEYSSYYYKIGDYFVDDISVNDDGWMYYGAPYYLQERKSEIGKDTLIFTIGTSTDTPKITKYHDNKRVYYLVKKLTQQEQIKNNLLYVKKVPSLTIANLNKTTRPCIFNGAFEKSYYSSYDCTPLYVFEYARTLSTNQIQYTPFFIRFKINGRGREWKISTYDWNLLHAQKLPVFRFSKFDIEKLSIVVFTDNYICFRAGGELHFFKNIQSVLKETGFSSSKLSVSDLAEYIFSLPVEIGDSFNDADAFKAGEYFIASGKNYMVYK